MIQPLLSREDLPISLRMNLQRLERLGPTQQLPLGTPERIIAELNVPESATVAVFGGGPDVFAAAFADHISLHGTVYSFELSDELSSGGMAHRPPEWTSRGYLKMRHKENGRVPLSDECVDLVVWAFVLRTLGHVSGMLDETRRILRPGGRIAVADWIRQDEVSGPRRDERVSAATCERCLAAAGFGLIGQRALNKSHYIVVGRRPVGLAGMRTA
ncbi:MAG: class I SAM-dependent methyltransferase [Gemmatimonadaceae bacterium]